MFDHTSSAELGSGGSVHDMQAAFIQLISSQVGHRTLASVSEEMRRTMLIEALRRAKGNLTYTGKLLGLSRQAVQQMLTALGLKPWVQELRGEVRYHARSVGAGSTIGT